MGGDTNRCGLCCTLLCSLTCPCTPVQVCSVHAHVYLVHLHTCALCALTCALCTLTCPCTPAHVRSSFVSAYADTPVHVCPCTCAWSVRPHVCLAHMCTCALHRCAHVALHVGLAHLCKCAPYTLTCILCTCTRVPCAPVHACSVPCTWGWHTCTRVLCVPSRVPCVGVHTSLSHCTRVGCTPVHACPAQP